MSEGKNNVKHGEEKIKTKKPTSAAWKNTM